MIYSGFFIFSPLKKLIMRYLLVFVCFIYSLSIYGQTNLDDYLPKTVNFNSKIPTPKSVIGHNVGEWHVTHDKLVQYMYALANASDRITIENRGTTYEGRPLLLLTVTSAKNQNKIKSIQKNHIEATNNSNFVETDRPVVVYQGFSIHGNEPSGSNAALLLGYYLAAAEGNAIDNMLDNVVILLDPAFNPDGLQRFANWANTNKNQTIVTDPNDREYNEPWPGGRTNHYWFDMNRDWLPVQLPESKARIKTFHDWLPNILTDHHEMGTNSTFFFQPGIPSRTHPLTPKKNQNLTRAIGNFHAKALDSIGSLYYSEESYDDFYYGKGSTYPDINGSIGILFEQASSRGHAQESENGVLTFPFTIKNQFNTALSTLKAAENLRVDLLNYQSTFFKNARAEASKSKNKAIIFGNEKDAAKTVELAKILEHHHIDFYDIKSNVELNGKWYKKDHAFVIPKNQKNKRLIDAMFETRTKFQDSLFYDVSAWTLPLAFNLDYDETTMSNAGSLVESVAHLKGGVDRKSEYAYLAEWHDYYTPKLLSVLLEKDVRVKVGLKQFQHKGQEFDYGTLLIPVQQQSLNSQELYELINKAAKDAHMSVYSVDTGLNEGIDLGSNNFDAIDKPKIAILVGSGISSYDAGEIWHLLDTRYHMAVTKLDVNNINRADLSRYNTIIMPSSYSGLNQSNTKKVKAWVEKGGILISYRYALRWLDRKKLMSLKFKKPDDLKAHNITFENRSKFSGAQRIGGAIFNTKLDRSHPINFGIKNEFLPMFRNTTLFLEPSEDSYNNPIQYTSTPLLSGYISEENLEVLGGTVPFKTQRLGRGRIIAFTDNTNFRAFWYGTNKLLMNAIFFSKQM